MARRRRYRVVRGPLWQPPNKLRTMIQHALSVKLDSWVFKGTRRERPRMGGRIRYREF
jgi:hypothetical protein